MGKILNAFDDEPKIDAKEPQGQSLFELEKSYEENQTTNKVGNEVINMEDMKPNNANTLNFPNEPVVLVDIFAVAAPNCNEAGAEDKVQSSAESLPLEVAT